MARMKLEPTIHTEEDNVPRLDHSSIRRLISAIDDAEQSEVRKRRIWRAFIMATSLLVALAIALICWLH